MRCKNRKSPPGATLSKAVKNRAKNNFIGSFGSPSTGGYYFIRINFFSSGTSLSSVEFNEILAGFIEAKIYYIHSYKIVFCVFFIFSNTP